MKITSVTDANGVTTTTIDTDAVSGSSTDFSSQLNEMLKTDGSLEAIFEKAAQTYNVDERSHGYHAADADDCKGAWSDGCL